MFSSDTGLVMLQISSLAIPYALVLASPGPNLLVILRASLASSIVRPLAAALGIGCGAALAAAIAVQGSLLLARADQLEVPFGILFAIMLVRSAIALMQGRQASEAVHQDHTARRISNAFGLGIVAALSNPMTIPFFLSFFVANPAFRSSAGLAPAIVFTMAASWFSFIGLFCKYLASRNIGLAFRSCFRTALSVAMIGYAIYTLLNIAGYLQ